MFQNTFPGFRNVLAPLTDSDLKANVAGEVTTPEPEEMSCTWGTGKSHLSAQVSAPNRAHLCFSWFTG